MSRGTAEPKVKIRLIAKGCVLYSAESGEWEASPGGDGWFLWKAVEDCGEVNWFSRPEWWFPTLRALEKEIKGETVQERDLQELSTP